MLMLRPLLRYADFQGRAHRAEYWQFTFAQLIVYVLLVAMVIGAVASGKPLAATGGLTVVLLLAVVVALGGFIPNLAVTVRRLHDSGKSGWWILLYAPGLLAHMSLWPIAVTSALAGKNGFSAGGLEAATTNSMLFSLTSAACNLVMLLFMVLPGQTGSNRFGPDPKHSEPDISVFDDERRNARIDDAIARAKSAPEQTRQSHVPVFDFDPRSNGPMITPYGRETQGGASPASSSSPAGWAKPAPSANAPRKSFGRR